MVTSPTSPDSTEATSRAGTTDKSLSIKLVRGRLPSQSRSQSRPRSQSPPIFDHDRHPASSALPESSRPSTPGTSTPSASDNDHEHHQANSNSIDNRPRRPFQPQKSPSAAEWKRHKDRKARKSERRRIRIEKEAAEWKRPVYKDRKARDSRFKRRIRHREKQEGVPDDDESEDSLSDESDHDPTPRTCAVCEDVCPDPDDIIDQLMGLAGLEEVKEQFLAIKSKVETCRRQKASLQNERFNAIFQGNPGTGKTTVARLYAKFLHSINVIASGEVEETSGAKLAYRSPQYIENEIDKLSSTGGVLFVDEAYQLTAQHSSSGGGQVLDIILTGMENHIGKLVVVFVGYKNEMESFYEHNPGLASRIPYTLHFDDFGDSELWGILQDKIHKKYDGNMKVEGGLDGLYMRIAIRRLTRLRGSKGFGNARAVENLLARISERQAKRLRNATKKKRGDYMQFTKEDLIGPDPSEAIANCDAWLKLQRMVGLDDVKAAAKNMTDMIRANYLRELREENALEFSLNRVFFGSPGTGKTTVAKLYGQILADLGLLSNGQVVIKNPADFIGQCLGKSEARTKAILAATVGKVLIIDEAYGLHSAGNEKADHFKTAVIDTLVAEIQGIPGDDRCVLLLGYEHQLQELFQHANPGLARRFNIENPFYFNDFDLPQLEKLLKLKMEDQDLKASPDAVAVAMNVLDRARMRPNFSNGGEVNMCLDRAKLNYLSRQGMKPVIERRYDGILVPADFDPGFNRMNEEPRCREYLQNRVAISVITILEGYQTLASSARRSGLDPREIIPTRFVFKGPPGTGKTTAAMSMGRVFYDMGILSTQEVIECSATDLIGQYVGSTGPKTKTQLERGLGKVLLIDDAYRLAEGQYGTEAVTEMIHLLSTPRYMGKIIVILAGYTRDMNTLMASRPNLCGFFPEEVVFENIDADDSMIILKRDLEERKVYSPDLEKLFPDPLSTGGKEIRRMFRMLRLFPSWSNARDIKNLAKQMAVAVFQSSPTMKEVQTKHGSDQRAILTAQMAGDCMVRMVSVQHSRSACRDGAVQNPKSIVIPPATTTNCKTKPAHQNACAINAHHNNSNVDVDADLEVDKEPSAPDDSATRDSIPDPSISVNATVTGASSGPGVQQNNSTGGAGPGCQTNDLNEQEEETVSEQQESHVQRLSRLAPCKNGFSWQAESNGYRCMGGSHEMSFEEANRLLESVL